MADPAAESPATGENVPLISLNNNNNNTTNNNNNARPRQVNMLKIFNLKIYFILIFFFHLERSN